MPYRRGSTRAVTTILHRHAAQVYDLETHFRSTVAEAVTLPELFRANGYLSLSFGKIFHEGLDDAASWTPQPELAREGLA